MRIFLLIFLVLPSSAFADIPLPYGTRTKAYSGYSTVVRGDNENVGMADAGVAIPGSISSLETNPAGLTMTMGSVSAQINSNEMQDRGITGSSDKKVRSSLWGLAVTPNDWGYSITSYSPSFEGARYTSLATGQPNDIEVSHRQVRLSVARAILKRRLSLGFSLQLDQATREISGENFGASGVSFKVGAIYHLKNHFLLGASFSPKQELGGSDANSGNPQLPGFAQPIRTPMLLNVGAGWIPNRFFSLGLAVVAVGETENTALLRDENRVVGGSFTFQPRIGASYTIAQYKFIKVSTAIGAYYEDPRTEGVPKRIHTTFAFQVNPYFMNVGFGIDRAERFNNVTFSIGVDIVRTLRTFKVIPSDSVPPLNGFWPKPLLVQADGLPENLTYGEEKDFSSPSVGDVKSIIEEIPANISNQLKGELTEFEKREKTKEKAPKKKISRKSRKKSAVKTPKAPSLPATRN